MRNTREEMLDQETHHSTYGESCRLLPFRTGGLPCWKGQGPLFNAPTKWMVFFSEFVRLLKGGPTLHFKARQARRHQSRWVFQSCIKIISIRKRGKNYLEEVTGQQMCPEGLETRRKSNSFSLWKERPSIQPSRKRDDLGPKLQRFCQGLYFFCPCFICPVAMQRTFSSKVVNLQVSWAFNSLNNLVFANVYFEPQSLFIKNNFLLEV